MAVAFIESGVSPGASSTTCVIVKPTNLAVGNLMLAHVGFGNTGTISAPDASWTSVFTTTTTAGRSATFRKIATSTDVAATNFTFTGTSGREDS